MWLTSKEAWLSVIRRTRCFAPRPPYHTQPRFLGRFGMSPGLAPGIFPEKDTSLVNTCEVPPWYPPGGDSSIVTTYSHPLFGHSICRYRSAQRHSICHTGALTHYQGLTPYHGSVPQHPFQILNCLAQPNPSPVKLEAEIALKLDYCLVFGSFGCLVVTFLLRPSYS